MALLKKAISLQDGQLEVAGRIYRRVLETQPKNAEALHGVPKDPKPKCRS